ncbi:4f996116-5b3e-4642-89ea-7400426f01cf [Sclerotinia trifoliorum]|uniref:4f996116-5b3e-4642-89ea-7400426f01cf n=1 Tax=Sclerotinia trifoliorum TaxID=28548 RepID=A0A8H2VUV8_9HELO|nr:4f996116-5b3e-4642-89ea-7400426f01cf [Sclerotinia trifoliorum]
MAHIVDSIANAASTIGLNNLIARELSVSPSAQDLRLEAPVTEEKEKHIWRMHQPSEAPRKYSIFPFKEKLSISSNRHSPSPESASTSVPGEKHNTQKPKDPSKRRKISITELGPMTTVHEVAMDSPTIPGRPALHERSFSAPGGKWRQHTYGESLASCIEGPTLDEGAEVDSQFNEVNNFKTQRSNSKSRSRSPYQPLSPKSLAPLVIPSRNAPMPQRVRTKSSPSTLRSPTPPQVPPKSARMMEQFPHHKCSPFTPSSSMSLSTAATTPSSPPEGRSSPKPWMMNFFSGRSSPKPGKNGSSIMQQQSVNSSITTLPLPTPRRRSPGHSRNQSETIPTKQQRSDSFSKGASHRRRESESSTSIMDRGRPKKRSDGSPIKAMSSKRAPTLEEQLAFEHLPQGVKAAQASSKLTQTEMETLRCQAIGQVCRFEVLNSKDVDDLSRELRALDERCLYLRKTHRSLRAGRRNLHDRICTYLRSPRTAKFSHDSILKQEEALAELDSSIDDWVSKLDQAENRRTRVRQKLLEHVAAAVFMPITEPNHTIARDSLTMNTITPPRSPPRSPIKGITLVLETHAEVDIEIEAEPEDENERRRLSEAEIRQKKEYRHKTVESIRIYADSDVFALLADVEDEINRMGDSPSSDDVQFVLEEKIAKSSSEARSPRKEKSQQKSQSDPRSSPSAPMSPFLLRPMVFTMPSGKQGVKV